MGACRLSLCEGLLRAVEAVSATSFLLFVATNDRLISAHMFEPIPLRSYFTLSYLTIALYSATWIVAPLAILALSGYLAAFALCVLLLFVFLFFFKIQIL